MSRLDELRRRHEAACDLKQAVDRPRIVEALTRWFGRITRTPVPPIRFAESGTGDAWDARAAGDARAARAAWDAGAARDATWDLSLVEIIAIGAAARGDFDLLDRWLPIMEAFEAGAWLLAIGDSAITVATVPELVATELAGERSRLHSASGPAFVWQDVREHYWHGVRVPEEVIEAPERITVAKIGAERNAEVRRVMIERYCCGHEVSGAGAYLRDAGAKRLDHDERWGTLWRRDQRDDEAIVMVEVVNRSPEPDGHFRHYFLRVHPELRPLGRNGALGDPQLPTARNAIASTFGLRGEEYAPLVEA